MKTTKKRLGPNDDVLEWKKPVRPSWRDQDAYDAVPNTIRLRFVSFHVEEKGFRTRNVSVVTTRDDGYWQFDYKCDYNNPDGNHLFIVVHLFHSNRGPMYYLGSKVESIPDPSRRTRRI